MCILIIMNLTDNRLEKSHQIALKEFMNCFPFPNFWKNVIIIGLMLLRLMKNLNIKKKK